MNINKAIKILEQHNKWRRDHTWPPNDLKMPNPKELGIAIDTVVNELSPLYNLKLTKKMVEARKYVDNYRQTNKIPPTYDEVRIFLGLASTNTAYHRLRGYRQKMH